MEEEIGRHDKGKERKSRKEGREREEMQRNGMEKKMSAQPDGTLRAHAERCTAGSL